ncbi:hypothetical protein [Vreelandella alkaliphila]|uniref:Uncharacterized protein n=1 Tax=Vreelandella alkaliphila TaxID=272774 RepID=A0AAJ2VSM1_9GAMM|nr:hypothetical protein [Halomonas alkaliphila]MDX5979560.1 hypothetical protein [Halomonas alkaliphila]
MTDLKQRYTEYNNRLRADGHKLLAFPCPACDQAIETQAAPAGDEWDTLANCPHCEAMYFKIVTSTAAHGVIPGPIEQQ